jgi:hypothetical protein
VTSGSVKALPRAQLLFLAPLVPPTQEPVERRMRQLEIQGPVWRAPSVREVLRGLPFLHHVPPDMFDWMLERGQLLGKLCGRQRRQTRCEKR